MVEARTGSRPDLDQMDLNDPQVLALFHKADTVGLFQFESPGMRRFLSQLKPTRFEDLVAANALFRPGPMEQIPTYVEARHNPTLVHYLDPSLEPILHNTYGVIVYQEQVMQIVQQLAGYTLGGADNLRRAMSKKKMAVMEENRRTFVQGKPADADSPAIDGCVARGIPADVANEIYDQMIAFAKYAFNKSHSVAYSYLAMQTGYLKCYYPCEYYAALLTSVMGDFSKMALYIKEAERIGVELLPPDVNRSFAKFSVEDGKMRFGLLGIKHVGTGIVEATVKGREEGEYTSLEEYLRRVSVVDRTALNRKAVESLIYAGALDSFGVPRAQMMADLEMSLAGIQNARRQNLSGQQSLFGTFPDLETPSSWTSRRLPEYPQPQKLAYEKEVLGIYLSGHPFAPYEADFAPFRNFTTEELLETENMAALDNRKVRFAGLVRGKRDLLTKKQEAMCFLEVEDRTGSLHCVVFPRVYATYRERIHMEQPLLLSGTLQVRDDEVNLLVDTILAAEDLPKSTLYVRMRSDEKDKFYALQSIFTQYPGKLSVVFYFTDQQRAFSGQPGYHCDGSPELLSACQKLLGQENVVMK